MPTQPAPERSRAKPFWGLEMEEKVRRFYNSLVEAAKAEGLYVIAPMTYLIDKETGEARSMTVMNQKEKEKLF